MDSKIQTSLHVAALALQLTERCALKARQPRINTDMIAIATEVASSYLEPFVPAGLWGWLVRAQVRETPRQYARRAVLCLVARATEAGVGCTLVHAGADALATLAAHGGRRRAAVAIVSGIERAIARDSGVLAIPSAEMIRHGSFGPIVWLADGETRFATQHDMDTLPVGADLTAAEESEIEE